MHILYNKVTNTKRASLALLTTSVGPSFSSSHLTGKLCNRDLSSLLLKEF